MAAAAREFLPRQGDGPLPHRGGQGRWPTLGLPGEIISYVLRVFAPADKPEVLAAILAKRPAQSVLPKAA